MNSASIVKYYSSGTISLCLSPRKAEDTRLIKTIGKWTASTKLRNSVKWSSEKQRWSVMSMTGRTHIKGLRFFINTKFRPWSRKKIVGKPENLKKILVIDSISWDNFSY
jgi:hypothetical protein